VEVRELCFRGEPVQSADRRNWRRNRFTATGAVAVVVTKSKQRIAPTDIIMKVIVRWASTVGLQLSSIIKTA
jgi:hypothetical protein